MSSSAETRRAHQRRVVLTLSLSQLLSGIGNGASLAVGSLLAVELTGSEAWGGATTTAISVAGALSALPLARLALRRGRRTALSGAYVLAAVGSLGMILAPVLGSFLVLLAAAALIGLGNAANLQARFAATDLAEERHRGRDLGLVVWAVTVGAVAGPNLIGPGASLAARLGLPETSGPFLFSLAGMVGAVLVLQIGLRPDPLILAGAHAGGASAPSRPRLVDGIRAAVGVPAAALGITVVVASHGVMVAVMSMTPVHLARAAGHGAAHQPGGHHHADTDTLVLIGLVISLHIAGMFALSPLMGMLSDRWGRLRTMLASQGVLAGAVVLGAAGAQDEAAVTVALVLLGLGWSMATVSGSAYVAEAVTGGRRVLVQGVTDTMMGAAGAVGAAGSGVVLALLGFPGLNLLCLLAVVAVGVWVAAARRGASAA
ncbi:MFS transporter [Nesterenkonia marinintestina]|uniref:MFS transporter n=1 Tax=Nesterenkonia marinintestina TaxID=2979865 RepID=UPI0021BEBF8D|nr:MFS transporter [Nesterenkonia sp. GX14115]